MMFIQTRILGKPSTAVFYGANIRLLTRVYSYVVFIICRAGERFAACWLCTFIWSFTSMCPYMNLINMRSLLHKYFDWHVLWIHTFLMLLVVNDRPQPSNGHTKGRSPVWVLTCFNRSPDVLKLLLHVSFGHLYGFSPVCVRKWAFKLYPVEKLFLHFGCVHLYGLWPVCERSWTLQYKKLNLKFWQLHLCLKKFKYFHINPRFQIICTEFKKLP